MFKTHARTHGFPLIYSCFLINVYNYKGCFDSRVWEFKNDHSNRTANRTTDEVVMIQKTVCEGALVIYQINFFQMWKKNNLLNRLKENRDQRVPGSLYTNDAGWLISPQAATEI